VNLRLRTERLLAMPVTSLRAAPPTRNGAQQIGIPTEETRAKHEHRSTHECGGDAPAMWRNAALPEVLEWCAGALAGLGGPAVRSIAVTSCHRGEGRSTVALALALLARTTYDRRTLLVELDLERPWLADALGLPEGPGVADVLRNETAVERALSWTDDDLAVLRAGDPRGAPAALLARVVGGDLLDNLGELFETLVVDLPPLEGTGSAALVARQCSTPLLVVRAGGAELRDIRRAVAMFEVPPPILMNGVSTGRAQTARRRSW
jgi:Mrp family chromosome partitioning ATPase